MRFTTLLKHSVLSFTLITLFGCQTLDYVFDSHDEVNTGESFSYPKPSLFQGSLNTHPTKTQVEAYQRALIDYIRYLEQYYITLGVYYGADTKSIINRATSEHDLQCRAVEGLFKDTPLPKPPVIDDRFINDTMNNLIDHIVELRQRIRNNNLYMQRLRHRYRGCK